MKLSIINVFIMGNVTLGGVMLQIWFISRSVGTDIVRCFHLYSFESYIRPFALKIKYLMTKGYKFCFSYLYVQNIISICIFILLLYEPVLRS